MTAAADLRVRTLADVEELERLPLQERDLPTTTYALLARSADAFAEVPAWRYLPDPSDVSTSQDLTYAALLARVHQVAHVLHHLHGGARGVTALLSPTHLETAALVLGAQVGGTFCAVNHLLEVPQVAAILRTAGTRLLVALGPSSGRDTWEKALAVADLLPDLQLVQLRADLPAAPGFPVLEELLAVAPDAPPAVLPDPDDVAAYFHTGGTTGTPKLAAHTHRNQAVNAWMMNALADGDMQGKGILAGLPWFHVNAWMVTGLATFAVGATAVVPGPDGYRDPRFYPAAWRLVERYGIAALSAVPTVYGALTQVPVDADISALSYPFVGAAPLTEALAETWLAHTGRPLLEGYGCTECTCTVTASPRLVAPRRGSQGLRLPYCEVRLAALGSDEPVAGGAPGRVLVRGPHVFAGYVQPDGSVRPAVDPHGWYDTGDLGRWDADGWLRLTGRAKDLIIRGGHNIDPALVVDALERHPAVALAAAVGRPDVYAGEVPVAYVQLVPGAEVGEADLLAYAATAVPERAAVPKAVHVLPALPVTAVGKVAHVPLREDAAGRAVVALLAEHEVAVVDVCAGSDAGGTVTVRVTVPAAVADRARTLVRGLPVATEVTAS